MKPVPYRAGNVSIGLLHRARKPPEYAQWIDTEPARSRRRNALPIVLGWLCGMGAFYLVAALLRYLIGDF